MENSLVPQRSGRVSRLGSKGEVTVRIGELARRTGVSSRALRYYDQRELLNPHRQPNEYRDYDESSVERVKQIKALLSLGFSIATIRTLLPCTTTSPGSLRRCPRTQSALSDQRRELDRQVAALYHIRTLIDDALHILMDDPVGGADGEPLR